MFTYTECELQAHANDIVIQLHLYDNSGLFQVNQFQPSSICLSRDRSIASSKLSSPKSAILSLTPDEASRIFFGDRPSRHVEVITLR
jgi:hypothetical protein